MIGLGYLSGNDSSAATGVSADGSVVVGNTYSQGNCCNNQAFRWTAVGGMVGLGSVSGYPISCVLGVNADGSVVVGVSYAVSLSQDQAFRWTAASGMVELGYLPGGNNSFANAVNADGSVVVGGSTTPSNIHNYEAFRWTQSGGMVGLGYLSGDNFSEGIAVNANGSVVVGCSGLNGNCDQAFLWTAVDGMKSVQALLKAKGVSTTAWTLMSAQGVSADGQVIVGSGVDPNGRTQGWIARLGLPGVPFDAFIATLDIDLHKKPNHDVFRLRSQFILGQNSNGIDPVHEAVTLDVGSFTTTIPPGSFKGKKFGPFEFHGVIDGVGLHVEIKPTGAKRYELEAKARDANLTGTTNPVSVTLTIGDDTGTTSVRADIDHDHDDDDDD